MAPGCFQLPAVNLQPAWRMVVIQVLTVKTWLAWRLVVLRILAVNIQLAWRQVGIAVHGSAFPGFHGVWLLCKTWLVTTWSFQLARCLLSDLDS